MAVNSNFLKDVAEEWERAEAKHPELHSAHEALGVLWEEFEEIKAEVFKKHPDFNNLYIELVQTAAMCYRFATDVLRQG